MTEEIIPNDGRAIDINSPTAKSIIEGVELPKPLRTWTIFKNTDNTLEGIEALPFAMWQVALDEIEKESDNVVFMSDGTAKLIMDTLERLEQENKELKEQNIKVKKEFNNLIAKIISDIEYTGEIARDDESPIEHLKKCQKALASLEEIRDIITNDNSVIIDKEVYFELQCGEPIALKLQKIYNKINEVLNPS